MIGPATITRASGSFRIAEVSPTGNLTLTTGVAPSPPAAPSVTVAPS
jgi:hypothetical protein